MKRIDQFQLYSFGKALKDVASFKGEILPNNVLWELLQAQIALERFINGDPFPLGLSKGAAQQTVDYIKQIFAIFFQTED